MGDIIEKLSRVRWQLDLNVAREARDEIIRLRAALEGVVREWEEAKAGQQLPMSVPFVVAVTMAGIARAALENPEALP